MIIFKEDEIKKHIQINRESIFVIEAGFSSLDAGMVTMPPIMRVDIPENNGEVDMKTAYIAGCDKFAVKISSGFFNNYQLGLPSGSGMMTLLSTITGVPQAILLDNGYLTHIRTAVAGAIAAKYLAKKNVETVGIIGTGSQARYQLEALKLVRDFKKVIVYGKTPSRVNQFINDMKSVLDVEIYSSASIESLVKDSEVVITTTPSQSPLIKAEWLHPGLHITSMGSDAEHKQELEAEVLAKADHLVCDVKAQCFVLGELHHGLEQGTITRDSLITEIGELTSGKKNGRTKDDQITICDLTGTGVQDTAIAIYAYERLVKRNLGEGIS